MGKLTPKGEEVLEIIETTDELTADDLRKIAGWSAVHAMNSEIEKLGLMYRKDIEETDGYAEKRGEHLRLRIEAQISQSAFRVIMDTLKNETN